MSERNYPSRVRLTPTNTLFEEESKELTVGGLTKSIKGLLERSFADVVVVGEISNLTNHRSGHRYWTLKDSEASISSVFWKTRQANFDIEEGMKVVCRGRVTVYPPRGNYQLDVMQIRPVGIGDLQRAYEALCAKLELEGLFEVSRKREIPAFPRTIGIVTSETGAALQDILSVLRRRYPIARVILRPAQVQGVGCELDIAQAIRQFNLVAGASRPDVLIVGRGGGALEDLWGFNEEAVARAIFSSAIPIISAVGHEVDTTIADLVADLRAPTPTAAAELCTPDGEEILYSLDQTRYRLANMLTSELRQRSATLQSLAGAYGMRGLVAQKIQELSLAMVSDRARIDRCIGTKLERFSLTLQRDAAKLSALSPREVLTRGYVILTNDAGVITSATAPAGKATAVFQDGERAITLD